ncbi:MAG: class I tRNA ligase family protein [Patescibacteria group bacterium]
MFQPVNPRQRLPEVEHEILDFWNKAKIFERSIEQRKGKRKYVFFDGPPFANGLPHYGHILANALKDAVTRYWTMKGYYVPRVNGWDCHGLPVEYEVEKELKLSGRKDIEKMGVAKFNTACRESVFRYTEEWEKLLRRIGRWVDFDNSYATLENNYIESIWWVFKRIWDKKMMYEGFKSMHVCPRCETPLSNFEVSQGYKEVTDLAVILKFEITDAQFLQKFCGGKKTSFSAWTTTPWSIPTTMGLAVGKDFEYTLLQVGDEQIICAKNRIPYVMEHLKEDEWSTVDTLQGESIVGISYKHPFAQYKDHPDVRENKNVYKTYAKDYVSVEDGTGIVTINGAFGEIDMQSAQDSELPIVVNVRMDGTYTEEMGEFAGMNVKHPNLNNKIAEFLAKKNCLLRKENIRHSYPHCWRCDTPLLNYATKSWFIKVTEIKDKLIRNNKKIHWQPSHIQDGRFGKWLEGARDWAISRNRFWGCPIPIWECACGNKTCVDSVNTLRQNSYSANRYIFVRHGEAENNVQKIANSDMKKIFHLTEKGKKQAESAAKKLRNYRIDLIFSSPFTRTKETAEIINQFACDGGREVTLDQHLVEHQVGQFEGQPSDAYMNQFGNYEDRYGKHIPQTESFQDVEKRVSDFVDYLDRKHKGKTSDKRLQGIRFCWDRVGLLAFALLTHVREHELVQE